MSEAKRALSKEEKLFNDMIRGNISKEEYEERETYKVGRRVRTLVEGAYESNIKLGVEGTIRETRDREVGIEFDENFGGHRLNQTCKNGHGWYIPTSYFEKGHIKLLDDDVEDDDDLLRF